MFEERVVQTACFKDGHPCTQFTPKTEKINVHCRNISFKQNINIYHLGEDSPLPLDSIHLPDGRFNNYCCRNSSHVLQVLGQNCSARLNKTLVDCTV